MKNPADDRSVRSLYVGYLDAVYRRDYYRSLRETVQRTCSHMDFAIGLGAAAGGGTGLGILADPRFAWLCAGITTVATVLAVAKTSYHWADRLQRAIQLEDYFQNVASEYKQAVEDVQMSKLWDDNVVAKYIKLREKNETPPLNYPFKDLPISKQREIQANVKNRIPYKTWWLPGGAAWNSRESAAAEARATTTTPSIT